MGERLDERIRDENGLVQDPALAVLLTQKTGWGCVLADGSAVFITPADPEAECWHYAHVNPATGDASFSIKPVLRSALAFMIEDTGATGADEWVRRDIYQGHPNPIRKWITRSKS